MKARISTVVPTDCLKVSFLIVLVKILWMELFTYVCLSKEMNA